MHMEKKLRPLNVTAAEQPAEQGSQPVVQACAKEMRGDTKKFASLYLVKPQTVRKRLCLTGSYFGVQPTKLPNGKLLWPLR